MYISNEGGLQTAIVLTETTTIVLCPRRAVILNLPFENSRPWLLYTRLIDVQGGRRRTPDNSNKSLMTNLRSFCTRTAKIDAASQLNVLRTSGGFNFQLFYNFSPYDHS
jgi:hypothetical protein